MKKIILMGALFLAQLCAVNVAFAATCSTNTLSLTLTTDHYGSETSWEVVRGNTQVASGSSYSSNSTYTEDLCLNDGDYRFTIYDSYGDGICCNDGNGNYELVSGSTTLASGGSFSSSDSIAFSLSNDSSGGGSGGVYDGYNGYYSSASGLTGYTLKAALYNITKGQSARSYSALWDFYTNYERDDYYERNGSILDIYSERPSNSDPYTFTAGSDQCGSYRNEGDCYNREHSFPRSWFGGAVSPMNTDIHHIFPTDGKVNAYRSSYPYGEVGNASYTSQNGSKLGSAASGLGYSGQVFEPIDEFKGDVARAYFYMATRYQNVIGGWENNTSYGNAVLDGTSNHVFENWALTMLKHWHQIDPVSQKEKDRNEAAYQFQGNRNPFVDYPELVTEIWGN